MAQGTDWRFLNELRYFLFPAVVCAALASNWVPHAVAALTNYGVLKGTVIEGRAASTGSHYQILVDAGGTSFRVAISARSQSSPGDLLVYTTKDFDHELTKALSQLSSGWRSLSPARSSGALDYVRAGLFPREQMSVIPSAAQEGGRSNLLALLDAYVQEAVAKHATLYAFGERWGPEQMQDKVFGFRPGNGVHNIHMNQGSPGRFSADDGPWQDGGLLFQFQEPGIVGSERWTALFLAFQSQTWQTDDVTGRNLTLQVVLYDLIPGPPLGGGEIQPELKLWNSTLKPLDLTGWTVSANGRSVELSGLVLPARELRSTLLPAHFNEVALNGGLLALVDAQHRTVVEVEMKDRRKQESTLRAESTDAQEATTRIDQSAPGQKWWVLIFAKPWYGLIGAIALLCLGGGAIFLAWRHRAWPAYPADEKRKIALRAPLESQGSTSATLPADRFHVFLSYNRADEKAVVDLATCLKKRGLQVWLDTWELIPGRSWQELIEVALGRIHSAAILVGGAGLGPWQSREMRALLDDFVRRDLPVIPVLLPGVTTVPELPAFLRGLTWVDLREGFTNAGLDRLVWGITGQKPAGQ